jgi:hypothetical protein
MCRFLKEDLRQFSSFKNSVKIYNPTPNLPKKASGFIKTKASNKTISKKQMCKASICRKMKDELKKSDHA